MKSRCRMAILDEAHRLCVGEHVTPQDASRQAGSLHVRALAAMRRRSYNIALAYLVRAIAAAPRNAEYVDDLAQLLSRMGRNTEAVRACLHVLRKCPRTPDAYLTLGGVFEREGRLPIAFACYRWAAERSADSRVLCKLAEALCASGQASEAVDICERAVRLATDLPQAHHQLGRTRLIGHDYVGALDAFKSGDESAAFVRPTRTSDPPFCNKAPSVLDSEASPATESDTILGSLHIGRGEALLRMRQPEQAAEAFREALTITPKDPSASRALVVALELSCRTEELAGAWLAFAAALEAQSRFEEATLAYQQVLRRDPRSLDARLGLGRSHASMNDPYGALREFNQAIALDPVHNGSHFGAARASMCIGDIDRGWDEFGLYLNPQRRKARALEQPVWDGSPLEGRTLLVWADQVLGDTIHWLRYVPVAKAMGGRVVLECQTRLLPLVTSDCEADVVVARGAPLPHFDTHVPLTLLPVVSRACRSPTPRRVPYLSVDEGLVERWRERLLAWSRRLSCEWPSPGKRDGADTTRPAQRFVTHVGLSWAGHPKGVLAAVRFAPLSSFGPLGSLDDVRYVSLQMGPQAAEMLAPPAGLHIGSLQDETCTLSDTAALMQSLDLIITVDTMIAHLAGAMARPVWLALPLNADWRWLRQTNESELYPTMTIFRQTRSGDWTGVFTRMREALASFCAERMGLVAHR